MFDDDTTLLALSAAEGLVSDWLAGILADRR